MTFRVIPVLGAGAEDVVVGMTGPGEGAVFTGTEDGAIPPSPCWSHDPPHEGVA
jgi:hypothetical protein